MRFPRDPVTARERRLRYWLVAWIITTSLTLLALSLLTLFAGCQIGPNYFGGWARSFEQTGVAHQAEHVQATASQPSGPATGGEVKTPLPLPLPIPIPVP